jgi:hypothetical protein
VHGELDLGSVSVVFMIFSCTKSYWVVKTLTLFGQQLAAEAEGP